MMFVLILAFPFAFFYLNKKRWFRRLVVKLMEHMEA